MTVSEQFAAYACGTTLNTTEAATIAVVQSRLLDYIAVSKAALYYADFAPKMVAFVEGLTGCTGKNDKGYPANMAAFLNAAYAHCLDYDDGHLWAGVHAAGPVIGTAFALIPECKPSGMELLQAVTAGYEVEYRLAKALGKSHIQKGYHGSCTCGVFGAAITAGRLYKLSQKQMAYALGLAGLACSGYRQPLAEGQMSKPVQVGYAAERGVVAALLAAEGMEAPLQIFEGKSGLFSILSDEPKDKIIADCLQDLGSTRLIADTYTKLYPCCRYTHPAIEACFALRPAIADLSAIKAIEVNTFDIAYEATLPNQKPQSPAEARFSMNYLVGVALHEGFVGLDDFTEESIARKEIRATADKLTCRSTKEWNDRYPGVRGAELRITMNDGTTHVHETTALSGMAGDHEKVKRKFMNACKNVYVEKHMRFIIDYILQIQSRKEVLSLVELLCSGKKLQS